MPRCLLLLTLIAACALHADTVYLENGNTLEGRVRYEKGKVIIEQANGEIVLDASKVEHVEPGKTAMDEFDEKFKALNDNKDAKAEDFVALGKFAKEKSLQRQTRRAFDKALQLDPENAVARQALGHVKFDGQWMSSDDANRARGLVKHGESWVTPEAKADLLRLQQEAEIANAHAEAERARVEAERLRLDRLEKQIEVLTESQRRDYPVYGGGYFVFPSRFCKDRPCNLPPPTTRSFAPGDSMYGPNSSVGKSMFSNQ
jgi:hypothetical protein